MVIERTMTNHAETVTILMSTYNGEKYLAEQIDSILTQSYQNINILVRDDGSNDGTVEILDAYKSRGKLEWYSGANFGAGRSFFDLVLQAPESDFYAFADQDDVWDKDKIEIAIQRLLNIDRQKVAMYCSATRPVDQNLCPIPVKKARQITPTFGLSLAECIASGCTYVFNRRALEEYRKYKSEYVDIHDWTLYKIIMALDGIVIFDAEPHISYRQHGNNTMGFQNRGLNHWVKRIRRFSEPGTRNRISKAAFYIRLIYYKKMCQTNRKIIDNLSDYKNNLSKKMYLILSKDVYMSHRIDNIIFILLIIVNLI